MQVIQPCLRIQIVATIAEGVQVGNIVRTSEFLPVSVLYGDGIAPAVIEVPYPQAAVAEIQRFHIAPGVGLYIVNIPSTIMIITDAGEMAISIIGIVELLAVAPLFIHQLAILIPVPVLFAVDCFAGAQPVRAILVCYGCTIFCELCQLSAIPAHAHAVAIGERIADFVAGDALTVIPCQQVFPLAVIGIGDGVCGFAQFAGGIGVNGAAGQVASAVIGIDHRCIEIPVVFPGQLSQCGTVCTGKAVGFHIGGKGIGAPGSQIASVYLLIVASASVALCLVYLDTKGIISKQLLSGGPAGRIIGFAVNPVRAHPIAASIHAPA